MNVLCWFLDCHFQYRVSCKDYSPEALGLYPEQNSNKLKLSGNVQKNVRNNILKVPRSLPGGF